MKSVKSRLRLTTIFLLAIVVLLIGIGSASAADKIFDKAALLQTASAKGQVRVIVQFEVPNLADLTKASLASTARTQETAAVEAAKKADAALAEAVTVAGDKVITQIPGSDYTLNRRLSFTPYLALTVSAGTLQALESIPEIVKIVEDVAYRVPTPILDDQTSTPDKPLLNVSVPLIGADKAWAAGYTGSGWYVAILDTGIRSTHEMFAGKTLVEACFSSTGGFLTSACPNGQTTQYGPGAAAHPPVSLGDFSHGTHVAGIATGNGPTLKGVAKGANIMPIQVFTSVNDAATCGGPTPCVLSYLSDQQAALDYVYSQRSTYNIASVNMSLGGGSYNAACDTDTRKTSIDNLKNASIATAIATGNSSYCDGISKPSCISSSVSVGASDDTDVMASFSNWYTNLVDVFAPGVGINSSVPTSDTSYASWDGTSMATPHVAGTWAILRQADPTASVDTLLARLQATAKNVNVTRCTASSPNKRRIQVNDALGFPHANAGPDQSVNGDDTVTLDGSASTDRSVSIRPITAYTWTQIGGTNTVTITPSTTNPALAYFTAPNADDTITIRLTVTNDLGLTNTDDVVINITAVGGGGGGGGGGCFLKALFEK